MVCCRGNIPQAPNSGRETTAILTERVKPSTRERPFRAWEYELGLEAVAQIRSLFPQEFDLVTVALKWVLMFEEVSCVIPGVSKIEQLHSNLATLNLRALSEEEMKAWRVYTRNSFDLRCTIAGENCI